MPRMSGTGLTSSADPAPTPRRSRRCLGPAAAVVAAVAVGCLAGSQTASAHLRSGTVAVDYRASVTQPRTGAYTAQIYQSDHRLTVTVNPPHVVELLGYLGEPVFRLDRRGLWINAASPTAAGAGLVTRAQSRPAAAPHWLLRPGRRAVTWHDARVQGLPAGVTVDRWSVPIIVDGRGSSLAGVLRRLPAPAVWV